MSYEGYNQYLCKNGHRYSRNCYDNEMCPTCGRKPVWVNGVDQTNCDDYGIIPESEWDKFIRTPEVVETCNLGHKHVMKEATYNIPTEEQTKMMRHVLVTSLTVSGESDCVRIATFDFDAHKKKLRKIQ